MFLLYKYSREIIPDAGKLESNALKTGMEPAGVDLDSLNREFPAVGFLQRWFGVPRLLSRRGKCHLGMVDIILDNLRRRGSI